MRPYENDDDYSVIVLGTARSPGVVRLSGHDRIKNWDVKEADGQDGASSTLKGDPIGEFRAEFYIADDELDENGETEFDRWDRFQFLLEAMVYGNVPNALPVYHPDLARNHFTEVSVKRIGGMLHDGKGGAIVAVDFVEYRPPKPKPAKRAKAKAQGRTAEAKDRYDPNAAAKATLAGLLEQARKP